MVLNQALFYLRDVWGIDATCGAAGKIIIVNGAASGQMQGGIQGGSQSKMPVLNAWLYDPYGPVGQRYTVLAASKIFRYYHSVALLLPDASVLIAGSEQSNCVTGCPTPAPTLVQYQAEKVRSHSTASQWLPTTMH